MKRMINPTLRTGAAFIGIMMAAGIYKANAQTNTNNYVITNTPRIAGIINDSTLAANAWDKTKVQIVIQYVDGLGRPIQTIQKQASPLGYDIISPQAYDQYGREITKYLPYTPQIGTSGSYRPNAVSSDQGSFYSSPPSGSGVSSISYPYAQTSFDNSPLNRPVEQGAPGADWQLGSHTVKMVYTLNNATSWSTDSVNSRQVAFYYTTINSENSQNLVANSYYAANTLTVTISKDENWVSGRAGTVEEYKDIDGHVVLKRVYNYTGGTLQQLSTYYVYDDLGRLAFVLPPSSGADGAGTISQTTLDNLCYQYQYDERSRPVQKKVPGKGWEYTVYNTMDQPVATQDANQRANNQWIYTKYDAQQRSIITGVWNNGNTAISRASLQSTLTGITTNLYEAAITTGNGYTDVAWPTSGTTANLNLTYYDNYSIPGIPYTPWASGTLGNPRGLSTATKTTILNPDGTFGQQLWTVPFYDNWGRVAQTSKQHYLGGSANYSTGNYDVIQNTYNFDNQPATTGRSHVVANSVAVTVNNSFYYDQVGRRYQNYEAINGAASILLSQDAYNEIGQLITKNLHSVSGGAFYQSVGYTYNERGWLLTSSAPLFAMQLYYNTGTNKQYNGNIAYQYYGTPGSLTTNYTYSYDKLNRLTGGTSSDSFNESGITYDLMGNITALNRYQGSSGLIDQLAYTYSSTNQVQSIADASGSNTGLVNGTTTYSYDANGNLSSNANSVNTGQNKSFTYNLLNLPMVATVSNGTATYTYDAAGDKLRKVSVINGVTTTTDYISGIQYKNSTTAVDFIQTEEGKAVNNSGTYDYNYYLGDNLGNTRVTFGTKTGIAVQYQRDDYYPFGMEINRSTTSPKNEYLYNKKELQEETAEYDYGARFYDPVIARWNTIDPLAEQFENLTPYTYTANNPIALSDPDGRNISEDAFGNITFDNVSTPDALNAGYILTSRKKDVYVDIEGNKQTRNKEDKLSSTGYYGQWAVFAAANLELAAKALESIVKPGQLDNLAIETHGGQGYGESNIDMVDNGTTNNFMYNGDIAKVVGTEPSGKTANCNEIEAKVDNLRGLSTLVKDNGNLILAVCDVGKGKEGLSFGQNINLLTGSRINTFLPTGFINAGIGRDVQNGSFIPFMANTFQVNSNPGWLKISSQGKPSYVQSIQMNISPQGPPIQIVK